MKLAPNQPEQPNQITDTPLAVNTELTPQASVPTETAGDGSRPGADIATIGSNPPTSDTPSITNPTASVAGPVVGGAIVTGSNTTAQATFDPQAKRQRFTKKRVLFGVGIAIALVGISAGYVFGYYIPNKPENVWAKAMTNSGKVYDYLTDFATEDKDFKGVEVEGNYKMKGALTSDGTISGKTFGQEGELSGKFSVAGLKLGVDLKALKSTGDTPDLYLKLSGLEGLGGLLGGGNPAATQYINGINNQWFVVDHSLFEQFGTSASETQFTKKDADSFLQAIGKPAKEYLFTADADKAVFVVKEFVGSEKKDDRNSYHYKVGYNSTNLEAYVKALCASLKEDKIGKLVLQAQGDDCAELTKTLNIEQSDKTVDVWVDKWTKLVHVVRINPDATSYIEISQDYRGGDELPFGMKIHGDSKDAKGDLQIKGVLNTKANTLGITGTMVIDSAGDAAGKQTGSFSLNIKPSKATKLEVDKPKDAKNLLELLNSLGLGSLFGSSTLGGASGSNAKDTERKSDLARILACAEISAANSNGQYPTLAMVNTTAWRTATGCSDPSTFKDPSGTSTNLVASPAKGVYAYSLVGRKITMTAVLQDGAKYTVTN